MKTCIYCELNTAGEHAWNCPLYPVHIDIKTNAIAYESGIIQIDNQALRSEIELLRQENVQLQNKITSQRSEIDLLKPQ